MLSDILASTDLINDIKSKLDDSKLNTFTKLLSGFKTGMWLYPGVLKRKVAITTEQTYKILSSMEKEGLLKEYYELYCGNCQKSSGIVVETISELPETFQCELCHTELPAIENAVLIYKVIKG